MSHEKGHFQPDFIDVQAVVFVSLQTCPEIEGILLAYVYSFEKCRVFLRLVH